MFYFTKEIYTVQGILEKFNMKDCKPANTPMEIGMKLIKATIKEQKEAKNLPYRTLIRCLMYLTSTTLPDIAYATNFLNQFNYC